MRVTGIRKKNDGETQTNIRLRPKLIDESVRSDRRGGVEQTRQMETMLIHNRFTSPHLSPSRPPFRYVRSPRWFTRSSEGLRRSVTIPSVVVKEKHSNG